jgi:hypothetical protein
MNESSSDNSLTPRPQRTQSLHQRVVTQVRKLSKSGKSKPHTMPPSSRPATDASRDDYKRPSSRARPESRRSQDSLRSHDHSERRHQEHLLKCASSSRLSPSIRSNTASTGMSYAPSIVTSDTTLQSPMSPSFYPVSHHPSASLHLSLCAYPSNDRLHFDATGTLWVAVEVAAVVKVDDSVNAGQSTTSFGPSLAVGIVIDNS